MVIDIEFLLCCIGFSISTLFLAELIYINYDSFYSSIKPKVQNIAEKYEWFNRKNVYKNSESKHTKKNGNYDYLRHKKI